VRGLRRGMLVGLTVLTAVLAAALVTRWALEPRGPALQIVLQTGEERSVDLSQLRRPPVVSRRGESQNQYGNWRDAGTYTGVLLRDLLGAVAYKDIEVAGADGYRVTIDRARVEDEEYPMALAYAFNGVEVPDWTDGFRIVVLPDDGRVSNEEYEATSAGSYWVKNVVRLTLQ
jgi:hypothetical protein